MLSRLTVLGVMSDLHGEPVPYDLRALEQVLVELAPDLLCLEVTQDAWERGSLAATSLPIRKALAPLAERSDIVIIPVSVSPREHHDFAPVEGLRSRLAHALHGTHRFVQRRSSIRTINGARYALFCHTVCNLEELFWDRSERKAWEHESEAMLANILRAVDRDPGRRVVIAAQCQRKHWLDEKLAVTEGVELVPYWDL